MRLYNVLIHFGAVRLVAIECAVAAILWAVTTWFAVAVRDTYDVEMPQLATNLVDFASFGIAALTLAAVLLYFREAWFESPTGRRTVAVIAVAATLILLWMGLVKVLVSYSTGIRGLSANR